MTKVSTMAFSFLVLASLSLTLTAEQLNMPLEIETDLSSGFGDWRQGHFHAGIDLRTGGKIGRAVYSPVDGYVWRVRTSFYGYGKGLYLKDYQGEIYVFGHLQKYNNRINKLLKEAQFADQRYYQDILFPPDSIPVSKGDLIAFSGQTGVGSPHLHFEKRSSENVPINPLENGFQIDDRTVPVFERLAFQLLDENSVLDNGHRRIFLDVLPGIGAGSYIVDTVLYFNSPFGIMADCFDRMRPGGMKQAIYKLSLFVDDIKYYELKYDSLDFDRTRAVELAYDHIEATNKRTSVRKLYRQPGLAHLESHQSDLDGIFGTHGEAVGRHAVRIVAEDSFGNRSQLSFDFLWGPSDHLFTLDSTQSAPPKSTYYYFTPVDGYEAFGIDSVVPFLNRGDRWGRLNSGKITELEEGRIKFEAIGHTAFRAVMRLVIYCKGGIIRGNIFNGVFPDGKPALSFTYEIEGNGLLVDIVARVKQGYQSRVELYRGDSLVGTEYPTFLNSLHMVCYIPPRPEYNGVDRIGVDLSRNPNSAIRNFKSLNLFVVGREANQKIEVDEWFSLRLGKDNFYEPRFIEIQKSSLLSKSYMRLNSDHYRILPVAFVCREDFEISLKLRTKSAHNTRSGICWLDEREDRWVWLENSFVDNVLTAKSSGGGSFAAVIDFDPPEILNLNYAIGATYYASNRPVKFTLVDSLSGVEDDLDVIVRVDNQWWLTEYDPETNSCIAIPQAPMKPGNHHLAIITSDEAGNISETYVSFFIRKKKRR